MSFGGDGRGWAGERAVLQQEVGSSAAVGAVSTSLQQTHSVLPSHVVAQDTHVDIGTLQNPPSGVVEPSRIPTAQPSCVLFRMTGREN